MAPDDLLRDDLVQLVDLEPVEHARRHGVDQVAGLDPRLLEPVATHEARSLQDDVVQLSAARDVRAGSDDERAG